MVADQLLLDQRLEVNKVGLVSDLLLVGVLETLQVQHALMLSEWLNHSMWMIDRALIGMALKVRSQLLLLRNKRRMLLNLLGHQSCWVSLTLQVLVSVQVRSRSLKWNTCLRYSWNRGRSLCITQLG